MFHEIGNVESNFNSQRRSSEGSSSYNRLLRNEVENKLYYLRDILAPSEFDLAVDEEMERQSRPEVAETELAFARKLRTLKKKVSQVFRRSSSYSSLDKS